MVSLGAKTKRMRRKKRKRKRRTNPTLIQTCARSMRTLMKWVQAAAKAIMNARVTEFAAQK